MRQLGTVGVVIRAIGFIVIVGTGCVSTGNSDLADDQMMAKITVGDTNKQQVTSFLGAPDSQRAIEVGEATREWWSYTYASATINPLEYILLYGFFFNGIGSYDTRYDVQVFFDHNGVVSSLSRRKTDYDMGGPFASLQVTSVGNITTRSSETSRDLVHFEERMEYR